YGLSLAAHLETRDVAFRIFGRPMETWRHHVPKGMLLKSDGFASSLSAPEQGSQLKDYCAANGLAYADRAAPVRVETFNRYAMSFQERFVPGLDTRNVVSLARCNGHFKLVLEDGETLEAHRVVLATGLAHFARLPDGLDGLPE